MRSFAAFSCGVMVHHPAPFVVAAGRDVAAASDDSDYDAVVMGSSFVCQEPARKWTPLTEAL